LGRFQHHANNSRRWPNRRASSFALRIDRVVAHLVGLLAALDLQAIVAHGGSFTPSTPGGIRDLTSTLPGLQQRVGGSASLLARSDRFGCLSIDRNDYNLAWNLSVRAADNTAFGHRELVLGVNARSGREWIAPDAEAALLVVEAILTDLQVHLRAVARDPDGLPTGRPDPTVQVIVVKDWSIGK